MNVQQSKKGRVWGRIKTLVLASAIVPIILVSAQASVIDRPFFRANALVIVFSGGDFVENNGTMLPLELKVMI